ncbi:hypothetical protein [Breoghania sp. L-A4]|uniref:hypothetical protein n=1 Tax=Breoghania sp. L-A4 TaxID=2304600 RepID=UPI0013C29F8E|nr:hypothetical protein [Breoghania sp. L-A4]
MPLADAPGRRISAAESLWQGREPCGYWVSPCSPGMTIGEVWHAAKVAVNAFCVVLPDFFHADMHRLGTRIPK